MNSKVYGDVIINWSLTHASRLVHYFEREMNESNIWVFNHRSNHSFVLALPSLLSPSYDKEELRDLAPKFQLKYNKVN